MARKTIIKRQNKRPTFYTGELYKLLKDSLPAEFTSEDDRLNTLRLAEALDYQRFTLYRWFNGGNMSVRSLNALLQLSQNATCERKGKLTREMLLPFCGL